MSAPCSLRDLLAERRANVIESMRERDPMARAMLEAHVATLDVEIARHHDVAVSTLTAEQEIESLLRQVPDEHLDALMADLPGTAPSAEWKLRVFAELGVEPPTDHPRGGQS